MDNDIEVIARLLSDRQIMVRTVLTKVGWVADIMISENGNRNTWTQLFPRNDNSNYVHPIQFDSLSELYNRVYDYVRDKSFDDIMNDKNVSRSIRETWVRDNIIDDEYEYACNK
jgi:hypothetical protein